MFACTRFECLPLNATYKKALDYAIFRTPVKIFETFSQDTVFNLPSVTDTISKQKINFLVRYSAAENLLCKVFASNAKREIKTLGQK